MGERTMLDYTSITTPLPSDVTTNWTRPVNHTSRARGLSGEVAIPLYSIIFLLALVGNVLVIVTLAQNRRMRTVTNVFLLNLSVSDLLLAVFCMPFTLIPSLLRDFIFGPIMCILIRYLQGVSVAVSVFTLVTISLERYFAICRPLRSRSWQTLSHAYRAIVCVWLLSFGIMVPIAVYSKHVSLRGGVHKCIEWWPHPRYGLIFTVFLDLSLLVVPLLIMLSAYGMIARTLWRGIKMDIRNAQEITELRQCGAQADGETDTDEDYRNANGTGREKSFGSGRYRTDTRQHIRHSNAGRSLQNKRRVIKMLFVVVLEFFICFTPLYAANTWIAYDSKSAQASIHPMVWSLIQLLTYISACCNPITYCFMNRKFRQGFVAAFRCCCVSAHKRALRTHGSLSFHSQRTTFTSLRINDSSPEMKIKTP